MEKTLLFFFDWGMPGESLQQDKINEVEHVPIFTVLGDSERN